MCRLTIRKLRLFSLGFLSFIIGTHPEWLADCFRIIGVCGILCSLIVTIGPWVPVGFCRDAVYTVLVISVTCIGLSVAYHDTIVRLGFPFEYATGISGTVLQDARIGSDGRCVVEIKLHRCVSVFGSESTASERRWYSVRHICEKRCRQGLRSMQPDRGGKPMTSDGCLVRNPYE